MSTKAEELTFISTRYPKMKVLVHPGHDAVYQNGTMVAPAKSPKFIQFSDFEYTTSDPEEIAVLKKCGNYTGKGERRTIRLAGRRELADQERARLVSLYGEEKVNNALETLILAEQKKKQKKKAAGGKKSGAKKTVEKLKDDSDVNESEDLTEEN